MTTYTDSPALETMMAQRGNALAVALGLKRDKDHKDRWQTAWGSKTDLGLYLTIQRMLAL